MNGDAKCRKWGAEGGYGSIKVIDSMDTLDTAHTTAYI